MKLLCIVLFCSFLVIFSILGFEGVRSIKIWYIFHHFQFNSHKLNFFSLKKHSLEMERMRLHHASTCIKIKRRKICWKYLFHRIPISRIFYSIEINLFDIPWWYRISFIDSPDTIHLNDRNKCRKKKANML